MFDFGWIDAIILPEYTVDWNFGLPILDTLWQFELAAIAMEDPPFIDPFRTGNKHQFP